MFVFSFVRVSVWEDMCVCVHVDGGEGAAHMRKCMSALEI